MNKFNYLINHVCFPCKLPNEITEEDTNLESHLLGFAFQVINYFSTFIEDSNQLIKIQKMLSS